MFCINTRTMTISRASWLLFAALCLVAVSGLGSTPAAAAPLIRGAHVYAWADHLNRTLCHASLEEYCRAKTSSNARRSIQLPVGSCNILL